MSVSCQFGRNLARCRKEAGLSQEEVSLRASLHRTEVSQLERGLRLARIDTVAKVAGAVGVDAGRLFQGITWEPGTMHPGRFEES